MSSDATTQERFFDTYSRFYDTSKTGTKPERLDTRYQGIIENNKHLFEGQRILDLASHDGRWSFAALKHGAAYMKGIEGNPKLIKNAYENFEHYGIPPEQYDFEQGDLHEKIREVEANSFDGLFCLGFLAHTPHQMFLLEQFERINPKFMVLDLRVVPTERPLIALKTQPTEKEYTAIGNKEEAWVGLMSRGLLEAALEYAGYNFEIYDFSEGSPWGHRENRITVTATRA